MPKILLCIPLLVLTQTLPAQEKITRKYAPEQVRKMIDDVATGLAESQPGMYRYHTPSQFQAYIDSVKVTVTDSLSELGIYRKLKPVVSMTGCLHTDLTLSEDYKRYLDQSPNLFPFRLYFEGSRAYVTENHSANHAILPGNEVLSINGRSMEDILRQLLPAIPSDGYNMTMKYLALYHQFPGWYRHIIEVTDSFHVQVNADGRTASYTVKGALRKELAGNGFLTELQYPRQLAFEIRDKTGFLTIHTFAASVIKRGKQQFRSFIDSVFRELEQQAVPELVVDLRYNTGGSDGNAAFFSGYFFDQPYRYWEKIMVTEKIAKEIKGIARIWYRQPVKQQDGWHWQKGKRTREFDYFEVQQPAKHPYKGKVYMLINGFCMSSCADVAGILHYNRKAVFVGEETGGGHQGNNSGLMPGAVLKPTGIVLTVPLQKYYTAVDTTVHFGRGTIPDVPVTSTALDMISGRDKAMETVMELITTQRQATVNKLP